MKLSNINSVPEGWCISYLSEVGKFISGAGFPEKYQNKKGLSYPFFKVGHLGTISSNEKLTLSEHTVDETLIKILKAAIIPIDSVVFAKIGMAIRLNRRRLIGVPSCIDNNVMAITPLNIILPKYLLRYLETIDFMPLTQATTVPSLPKTALENLEIPLPPLNEQRRIVAKLEVLLGKVDGCQKRLEKIPRILKRFRQSVLAAACDGRLTADWREGNKDVEPAKKLLRRVEENKLEQYQKRKSEIAEDKKIKIPFLEKIASNFETLIDIPETWCFVLLGNIVETKGGIQKTPLRKPVNNIFPYLRVANVGRGKLNLEEIEYFELLKGELESWKLKKNDLLIVEGNGSVTEIGRCAIWNEEIKNCVHQNHIIRCRPEEEILAQFLLTFLNSPIGIETITKMASSTSGLHTLSVSKINKIIIPLAPLAEQQEIVRRVESLFKLADQLEGRYQKAKSYVDKLTQSILAKAFRGELVAQDPNDEPASVLLERIKQEKEAATTEKTRKVSVKSKVANKKESKEIIVENKAHINDKFVEIVKENKSSNFNKMVADIEKLGEQMTLPFIGED